MKRWISSIRRDAKYATECTTSALPRDVALEFCELAERAGAAEAELARARYARDAAGYIGFDTPGVIKALDEDLQAARNWEADILSALDEIDGKVGQGARQRLDDIRERDESLIRELRGFAWESAMYATRNWPERTRRHADSLKDAADWANRLVNLLAVGRGI